MGWTSNALRSCTSAMTLVVLATTAKVSDAYVRLRTHRALPGTQQECGIAILMALLPVQPRHLRCRAVAMRLRRIRKLSFLRRMRRDISRPSDALWGLPSLAR